MTATYDDLQEQVIHLKALLAGLTGDVTQHTRLRHAFGLSPKQAETLALLINTARPLRVEAIYANVYQHLNGGGPDMDIVKVAVCQLRVKLGKRGAPAGISNAYGTGCYALSNELRTWIRDYLQPVEMAA